MGKYSFAVKRTVQSPNLEDIKNFFGIKNLDPENYIELEENEDNLVDRLRLKYKNLKGQHSRKKHSQPKFIKNRILQATQNRSNRRNSFFVINNSSKNDFSNIKTANVNIKPIKFKSPSGFTFIIRRKTIKQPKIEIKLKEPVVEIKQEEPVEEVPVIEELVEEEPVEEVPVIEELVEEEPVEEVPVIEELVEEVPVVEEPDVEELVEEEPVVEEPVVEELVEEVPVVEEPVVEELVEEEPVVVQEEKTNNLSFISSIPLKKPLVSLTESETKIDIFEDPVVTEQPKVELEVEPVLEEVEVPEPTMEIPEPISTSEMTENVIEEVITQSGDEKPVATVKKVEINQVDDQPPKIEESIVQGKLDNLEEKAAEVEEPSFTAEDRDKIIEATLNEAQFISNSLDLEIQKEIAKEEEQKKIQEVTPIPVKETFPVEKAPAVVQNNQRANSVQSVIKKEKKQPKFRLKRVPELVDPFMGNLRAPPTNIPVPTRPQPVPKKRPQSLIQNVSPTLKNGESSLLGRFNQFNNASPSENLARVQAERYSIFL